MSVGRRNSDLVVRYGGDEVLCILPNSNILNTHDLAERIRQLVEDADKALYLAKETGRNRVIVDEKSSCFTILYGKF